MADEVLRRARVEPPIDAIRVAVALGFEVRVRGDLGGPSGLLVGRAIAVVPGSGPQERQFVVAHEIAHAINNELRLVPEGPSGWFEEQMDLVAAAILAPRGAVMRSLRDGPAAVLALFANVPREVLANRLIYIGAHSARVA